MEEDIALPDSLRGESGLFLCSFESVMLLSGTTSSFSFISLFSLRFLGSDWLELFSLRGLRGLSASLAISLNISFSLGIFCS